MDPMKSWPEYQLMLAGMKPSKKHNSKVLISVTEREKWRSKKRRRKKWRRKAVGEAEELPKTVVRRLVKDKLSELSKGGEISVLREALQAFSESSRIFIHYLSEQMTHVRSLRGKQSMPKMYSKPLKRERVS